jgi:hypothetical protein
MTTYLIKETDGKTNHFRATVNNKGVDIVQGTFYNWLSKSWEGCGNNDNAIIRQKELVDEKRKDNYKIAEYSEILENTVDVYDKAKWHFGGDFPQDLDDFQGYVHTGMFLGWIIGKDLVSDEFKNDHSVEIEQFKKQELTGSQIFERCCDGILLLEDISELGNRFSLPYFNFDSGQYLNDYDITLSQDKPTMYHVEDTWDSFLKIKTVLDQRFDNWTKQNNKKSF